MDLTLASSLNVLGDFLWGVSLLGVGDREFCTYFASADVSCLLNFLEEEEASKDDSFLIEDFLGVVMEVVTVTDSFLTGDGELDLLVGDGVLVVKDGFLLVTPFVGDTDLGLSF